MVEQVEVSATERAKSTLSRIDHEVALSLQVDPGDDRTAEQWARAMLEEAPLHVRRRLRQAWRALGVRLEPLGATSAVLGWKILVREPHQVLLGVRSPLGLSTELLVLLEGESLVCVTFVRLGNPMIRAVWTRMIPRHVQVVTALLRRAAGAAGPPGVPQDEGSGRDRHQGAQA